MGSGYTVGLGDDDLGIIPRVIGFIFQEVKAREHKAEIIVKCSFLEIYNEELHDLLETTSSAVDRIMPTKKEISIREEKNGMISVYGLKEVTVKNADEMDVDDDHLQVRLTTLRVEELNGYDVGSESQLY